MVDGRAGRRSLGRHRGPRERRAWGERTRAVIFSGTKGIVATALLLLVERGALDLGAAWPSVWPEFGGGRQGRDHGRTAVRARRRPARARASRSIVADSARDRPARLAAQAPIVPGRNALLPRAHLRLAGRRAGAAQSTAAQHRAPSCATSSRTRSATRPARSASPRTTHSRRSVRQLRASRELRARPRSAASEPDPRLRSSTAARASRPRSGTIPALLALEVPAANGVATARAMATLYGALVGGRSPLVRAYRSRLGRSPRASATIRSRAGRCASAPPATSWRERPASSARPRTRSGTPARAAPRTAPGRRCARDSRTSPRSCAARTTDSALATLLAALHEALVAR